ncbi:peptidase inhibitor family I36 protein [Streptomyces sp. NPDC051561]|uniref:peptidase inhibitor family I36 protein n=1 Tax=Streptomyces sp. NPDC051561 TaxID=3365658 RepID=UPI0037B8D3A7
MFSGRIASAVAAAALVTLGMAVPAAADSGPGAKGSSFGAQAQQAGLTEGQATALQERVESRIAQQGGRQVSANEIALPGASLLVAVPGEKYARDLATPGRQSALAWECDYEYFCMYRGTNGTGDRLALYKCQNYGLTNWVGTGSYYNRQTPGTKAQFKNQSGAVIWTTGGAPSFHANYDWDPVWTVKPC